MAAVEEDAEIGVLLEGLPLTKDDELVLLAGSPDLLVAIGSVVGLDAAIAVRGGRITGTIRGIVLPTASSRDCNILKTAAAAGVYRGTIPFAPLDESVADAKLAARAWADQARADLLLGGYVPTRDDLKAPFIQISDGEMIITLQDHARGVQSFSEWEINVEATRINTLKLLDSNNTKVQEIRGTLDLI